MAVPTTWPQFTTFAVDECWPWHGYLDRDGYGKCQQRMAHRIAYEAAYGPIPVGMEIDHTCHNADLSCIDGSKCSHRRCVNPQHLEAVTHLENVRRSMRSRERSYAPRRGYTYRPRTHCQRGHLLDEANTYRAPSKPTQAICRTCLKAQQAQNYLRLKARGYIRIRSSAPKSRTEHAGFGVSWDADKSKWRVRLKVKGLYKHFGYFPGRDAAINAARVARLQIAGVLL